MTEIHQFLPSLSYGDAQAYHALALRRILRERWPSEIFFDNVHRRMSEEGHHFWEYSGRPSSLAGEDVLLYHLGIGSPLAQFLLARPERVILYYHNITPPEFFAPFDPAHAEILMEGRRQLEAMASKTVLAWAASEFSRRDLESAGYRRTAVMPLLIDFARYDKPPDERTVERIRESKGTGPDILFVGRVAPNKNHSALVKVLHLYRRLYGDARLFCVGPHHPHTDAYSKAVDSFARDVRVEGLRFTGAVSFAELLGYYHACDMFVCLSEHEGFGVPLLEAMHLGLPVIAYDTAAVGETVGDGGLRVCEPDPVAFAAAVHRVHTDAALRGRLIEAGRRRTSEFAFERVAPRVLEQIEEAL